MRGGCARPDVAGAVVAEREDIRPCYTSANLLHGAKQVPDLLFAGKGDVHRVACVSLDPGEIRRVDADEAVLPKLRSCHVKVVH